MGAHALPVVTGAYVRDTAEVFDHHAIDADAVAEQARTHPRGRDGRSWKVGFLGSPEGVSAVAEILVRLPRRAAGRLHAQPVLGRGRRADRPTSTRFANWCCRRPRCWSATTRRWPTSCCPTGTASARRRRASSPVAAGEHGARYVLVTGVPLPDQFIDNVLASPQGALTGEKFERFEAELRRRRRHAVGRAGRAAGQRQRAARGRRRGAGLPGPAPRRGLPPRHGQRAARPLLLGAAAARTSEDEATTSRRRRRHRRRPCPSPRHVATDATDAVDQQRQSSSSAPSAVIPGGVNSPVRAFRAVGGTPRFIAARRRARTSGTPRASATSTTSAPGVR